MLRIKKKDCREIATTNSRCVWWSGQTLAWVCVWIIIMLKKKSLVLMFVVSHV